MKSRSHFHFKKFSIAHGQSTHKVGTDGVLLGAWADVQQAKTIVDIGTGSGVIALMLAQRSAVEATIDAIEIERADAEQASLNVANSPWPDKIRIRHTSLQQFKSEKEYDLIVSNPPYFVNSLLPPEKKRSQARHTHALPFEILLECSTRLLRSDGKLAVILPYEEASRFLELSGKYGLYLSRQCEFRSRAHKPVERMLLELEKKAGTVTKEQLTLYHEGDTWSDEYKALTREFYLLA